MFFDQTDQGTGWSLVRAHCGIGMNGRFGEGYDRGCQGAGLRVKVNGHYGGQFNDRDNGTRDNNAFGRWGIHKGKELFGQ